MKGSINRGSAAPTDLLVCFPSRAHLALMPKPICSPSRPTEPSKRHYPPRRSSSGIRPRTKRMTGSSDVIDDEPTSPKVTCAGQIKVRPKHRPGKDWVSVVEGIERLHQRKKGKKTTWLEALGFKKDAMQLLGGALRGLRFNAGGCFGSFAAADCSTDEEEDGDDYDEEEEEEGEEKGSSTGSSRAIFSKWFMVLEESQGQESKKQEEEEEEEQEEEEEEEEKEEEVESSSGLVPPPNALLLMRCRSAPAKGWLKGEGEDAGGGVEGEEEMPAKKFREEEKEKERLLLMSYAPDFFKVSTDIAKETWVVGTMDPLNRCRSWKR